MKIIRSIKVMQDYSGAEKKKGKKIGFVPTMGALHQGHLSLIKRAREENNSVVVSIFVNPAQFGPKEDFKKYPRDLQKDALLCKKNGVDVIFYPSAKAMYPPEYKTHVNVQDLSSVLCGKSRPGHFQGVATVVAKLFNIVGPTRAYFGQKDAQQATIINRMALDLNLPVKVRVLPTIREKDGLALSSRNLYLSQEERKEAVVLSEALKLARKLIRAGEKKSAAIIAAMRKLISSGRNAKIDYISIVDAKTLKPVPNISGKCLIALAVWIGKTRLIDNTYAS
ncbi:MAG: pantoate--beta-alanine ligase [Candidatus Omnitrophica bacterium]|nr:pantoate--beta-alanine ligase [Candidatus Omnitrophota bacterium]MDD5653738.1 pantoate--beta-alanine ligase [Candidatus Omnitrophota bacterium]